MEVSSPASQFARRVNLHTLGTADNPYQCSFRQHFPATHTGALRQMFSSTSFARHTTFLIVTA